jgi:hypothetical protein
MQSYLEGSISPPKGSIQSQAGITCRQAASIYMPGGVAKELKDRRRPQSAKGAKKKRRAVARKIDRKTLKRFSLTKSYNAIIIIFHYKIKKGDT